MMRCTESEDMDGILPDCLARGFQIEARVAGQWRTVWQNDDNFRRLVTVTFPALTAEALRLTLTAERQPGIPARLFAFEPLDPTV